MSVSRFVPTASAAILVAVSTLLPIDDARAQDAGLIHACVQKSSGQLRVVDAPESCTRTESPVSWSVKPAAPRPVIWSGGCGSYGSGQDNGRYCTNFVDFNTAEEHLTATAAGVFTIRKPGFYRISFFTVSSTFDARVTLYRNGEPFQSGLGQDGNGGFDNGARATWRFEAGDTFEVRVTGGGWWFSYAFYPWPVSSRLQIEYAGPLE